MTKFKLENVELFHRSMELMKTDDFESFRALVDQLGPDDREEVLQMYKKIRNNELYHINTITIRYDPGRT